MTKQNNTKRKRRSFEELVKENKLQLLRDPAAMEKMEEKFENKYVGKAQ
jgi:hypothetical protein